MATKSILVFSVIFFFLGMATAVLWMNALPGREADYDLLDKSLRLQHDKGYAACEARYAGILNDTHGK
jgi:hypothetical protein